ncbi:MAG TPA: hypothetical protein GXX28_04360 [Firmicutes bacterium]|nr:hypothetical protein [Bacillota bacterium]
MNPDNIRGLVVAVVGLVAIAVLIKALFIPNPMDILVLFALILAAFALFDFNLFNRPK